jgi:hypothetical protein
MDGSIISEWIVTKSFTRLCVTVIRLRIGELPAFVSTVMKLRVSYDFFFDQLR